MMRRTTAFPRAPIRDAGSEEFARLAPPLFEMAAKALAFDVAHRRGWIAPNE